MNTFAILYPALMIAAPALFVGLWCLWTGVRAMRRILLATLGMLIAFALSAWLLGPERTRHPLHFQLWGLGGLMLLVWGFAVSDIRRAFAALPAAPRGASLRPRQPDLFPGAFAWPGFAWISLVVWLAMRGGMTLLLWIGPALGGATLVATRLLLRLAAIEPEPLGGRDAESLARRYGEFRRRRVRGLYWMSVSLALLVTAGPLLPSMGSAIAGTALGVLGALFGTWADAQRYLIRRQLSGAEPPR